MPHWLTAKRLAIVLGALVLLGVSHWATYKLGIRTEHERTAATIQALYDNAQSDALVVRLEGLRVIASHAQQFSAEEIKGYATMSEVSADRVERTTVAKYRQAGNDPEADAWQARIDETRRLVAKLKK